MKMVFIKISLNVLKNNFLHIILKISVKLENKKNIEIKLLTCIIISQSLYSF